MRPPIVYSSMHMHVRNLEESQKLIHCERATLCMSQVFETYQKFSFESVPFLKEEIRVFFN